ncbi:MAG: hypothetical protein OJF60_001262 [Burkholderiaceae bacterium]|nr:MAG: hypothetical protein OJF60_001262 [Burkholderiaceae bacterium]
MNLIEVILAQGSKANRPHATGYDRCCAARFHFLPSHWS